MSKPFEPTDPRDREEEAILAALSVLDADDPDRGLGEALVTAAAAGEGGDAEADATLRRLYVETLGLLAWAPPAAAADERSTERVKARLMAAIASGGAERGTAPPASGEVVPLSSARREAEERRAPGSRRFAWMTALAALFAAAAVGLAGWFYVELDRTRDTLARLQGDRSRLSERLDRQEALIRRSAGMGDFLTAVSTAGVEICPLRPVGDPALHPQAFAILYMPPGSGEWYLLATNLARGEGVYKVWLNTPDGAVPVGFLEPGDESALEIELPPDIDQRHELMLSIVVTLEPSPDMPDPSGPMVLFGDEVMKVL